MLTMSKTTQEKVKMLGVRLPVDLIRQLRAYAALHGWSAAGVVRDLLEHSIPSVMPMAKRGNR